MTYTGKSLIYEDKLSQPGRSQALDLGQPPFAGYVRRVGEGSSINGRLSV